MIYVDEDDPSDDDCAINRLIEANKKVSIRHSVSVQDHYELNDEIGRGKFGTVYSCVKTSTGEKFAAKFINIPRKEDRRCVEREIELMRDLRHPRLIQLYDAFDNGKVMCLILELIEGGELFDRIVSDDFILTEKSCTAFMRQICRGIEFIHQQKILHLDLKPENILCLTKTGNRIKIIDFGLARRYDPQKKLQVLFGTPEFVAPEVVNFDEISFGTDMWSVGVITYVLLSGLSPFMGETDIETMANVTIAKYDFEDESFQNISESAKDFIRKLLNKNQHQRISATECLEHEWLKKNDPQFKPKPDLNQTKDQLRTFVERWRDHPSSPYIVEHVIDARSSVEKIEHDHNYSTMAEPSTSCRSSLDVDFAIDKSSESRRDSAAREITCFTPALQSILTWKQMSRCLVNGSQKKFNERSRDVPLNATSNRSHSDGKERTKDLLLYLLDKWNESFSLAHTDLNSDTSSSSNPTPGHLSQNARIVPRHKSVTALTWKDRNDSK